MSDQQVRQERKQSPPVVAVVIPTYNESGNIDELKERLDAVAASLGGQLRIVFVDDASPDGTAKEVRRVMERAPNVHLLERKGKLGLGTAFIDGFRYALGSFEPDIIVQMDGDLQHPPEKVGPLVETVAAGADVAVASRYIAGGSFKGLNWWRRLVSRGANWLARTILQLDVRDATTGFKAMNRRAVDVLLSSQLHSSGFIFQVESLYVLKSKRMKAVEVAFTFEERARGASKMSVREIWEFFWSVIALRFRRY